MDEVSVSDIIDAALDRKNMRSSEYEDDPDLDIKKGDRSKYRIMLTPKNERKLDAYMFAEINYNEVSEGAENYQWFKKQSPEFKRQKHDKIPVTLTRLPDPWIYQFPMAPDCDWWFQLNFYMTDQKINLEKPEKGVKYRP